MALKCVNGFVGGGEGQVRSEVRDSSIVEWRRAGGSRTVQRKVVKRTVPLPLVGSFLARDMLKLQGTDRQTAIHLSGCGVCRQ